MGNLMAVLDIPLIQFLRGYELDESLISALARYSDSDPLGSGLPLWLFLAQNAKSDIQIDNGCRIIHAKNKEAEIQIKSEESRLFSLNSSHIHKGGYSREKLFNEFLELEQDRKNIGRIVPMSFLERMIVFGGKDSALHAIGFYSRNAKNCDTLISHQKASVLIAKYFIFNKDSYSEISKSNGGKNVSIDLGSTSQLLINAFRNKKTFNSQNLVDLIHLLKKNGHSQDSIEKSICGECGITASSLLSYISLGSFNHEMLRSIPLVTSALKNQGVVLRAKLVADIIYCSINSNEDFAFLPMKIYGAVGHDLSGDLGYHYRRSNNTENTRGLSSCRNYVSSKMEELRLDSEILFNIIHNCETISEVIFCNRGIDAILSEIWPAALERNFGFRSKFDAQQSILSKYDYYNDIVASIITDFAKALSPTLNQGDAPLKNAILDTISTAIGDKGGVVKSIYDAISTIPISKIRHFIKTVVDNSKTSGKDLRISDIAYSINMNIEEIYQEFSHATSDGNTVFFESEYTYKKDSDGEFKIRITPKDELKEYGGVKFVAERASLVSELMHNLYKEPLTRLDIGIIASSYSYLKKMIREHKIDLDIASTLQVSAKQRSTSSIASKLISSAFEIDGFSEIKITP